MKIGPRLPMFCHLMLGGPVIMTHRNSNNSNNQISIAPYGVRELQRRVHVVFKKRSLLNLLLT